MKWRSMGAYCLFAAFFALMACRGKTWQPPIRITATPWVGNTALVSAQENNRSAPLDVRVVMLSTDFDAWRAIIEHRADMFSGTVFDMIRAMDQGVDMQIVMALDFSSGADGIIARAGIDNLAALKGKKVAVERCTTTHFVLLRALEQAGMREEDVILENVATDEALRALDDGRVDAAALWDPFLSSAQKPGRRILFTSAEIPGEVIDVLGVRADLLTTRTNDIDIVLRGIHAEVAAFEANPAQAVKTVAFVNELAPDAAEKSFGGVHFVNARENVALFDRAGNGPSIWKSYELAAAFLKNHDMLRHPVRPVESVIDASALTRVAGAQP